MKLIKSYLTNRCQGTKPNTGFSKWTEILLGVPQESALGPLLFNIYINDLFFLTEKTNACNYADDTAFYACNSDLHYLISRLEHDSVLAIEWFECNYMKLNQDKCHLVISRYKYESVWANIGPCKIWESNDQKLLGVNIDRNVEFNHYVLKQCIKAERKPSALTRICKFMSLRRRRVLMKYFNESQVAYCPLVWMCCDKTSGNGINRLHECTLRIVYNDNVSIFEKLVEKNNSVTIHLRSLGILAIELYKTIKHLAAPLMHEIFEQRNIQYNLRSQTDFQLGSVKTVNCGLRALRYLGPKIWNIVPFEIKNSETLAQFKMKIKSWKPAHWLCNLYQPYFHCLGHIQS